MDALRLRYFGGDTNTCTLERMMLAGIPVRDLDVLELASLLREAGFDDVAARLRTHTTSRAPVAKRVGLS